MTWNSTQNLADACSYFKRGFNQNPKATGSPFLIKFALCSTITHVLLLVTVEVFQASLPATFDSKFPLLMLLIANHDIEVLIYNPRLRSTEVLGLYPLDGPC
jgi:hypothetical protein